MEAASPAVHPSAQRAVSQLHSVGARFVLLAGKRPAGGLRGLYDRERPSPEQVMAHLQAGKDVALEPGSICYAVADVDGPRKGEEPVTEAHLAETVQAVQMYLGEGARPFPSMSGGGKSHVWRKIDVTDPAPLGYKDDGKPYISAPTDMYLSQEGPGSGTAFDIRFKHSYVRITNYLVDLADFVWQDKSNYSEEWKDFIHYGKRWKPSKPPVPATPVMPVNPVDDAVLERMNQAYIDKLPALTEGARHNLLNETGYKAGQESAWNPKFLGMLKSWAGKQITGRGSKAKLAQLDKAFADGQRNPVPRPERKNVITMPTPEPPDRPAPPLTAYAQDQGKQPAQESDGNPLYEFPLANSYVFKTKRSLLFDEESQKWFRFKTGWRIEARGRVIVAIRKYVMAANPDPSNIKLCAKYASESIGARIYKMISEITERKASETFDQNPLLIGLKGGQIYELTTGRLRAAKLEDYVSRETGCMARKGKTPMFDRFMLRAFDGDSSTIAFVLRFVAYSLTGMTSEHKALFFQGAPATGKSALIDIIKLLLGTYCKAVPAKTFVRSNSEEHPTVVANLKGPRLVTFAETGDGKRLDDEMMNSVIAGDAISGRYMRGDYFEFTPCTKLIMSSNFRPRMSGPESGIFRRLRVVLFRNEIPEKDRILGMAKTIFEKEGPAILYRLLEEARAWYEQMQKSGRSGLLPESAAIREETARYFAENDPIGEFIAANIVVEAGSEYTVSRAEVYARYKAWAEEEGHAHTMTQSSLTRKLLNRLMPQGVREHRTSAARGFACMYLKSKIEVQSGGEQPF